MDVVTYALLKKFLKDSIASGAITAGKSAYEVALENGFEGSEVDWLNSLKGTNATISIGGNGNWIINGSDSGISAVVNIERIDSERILELFN